MRKLNESVVGDLQSKGLAINRPSADSFRAKLRESGFYAEWKGKFGDEAWALLEAERRQARLTAWPRARPTTLRIR